MNKNLLVEIFVPIRGDGNTGLIGTGYPVAKDRILTARHVLFPKGQDKGQSIAVRWYQHPDDEARQWRQVSGIVWQDEQHDVAVLECRFPDQLQRWGVLSEEKPHEQMRWKSEGFASAGKREDGTRRPVPMMGGVFSMSDTATVFHLGADYPAGQPDGWSGASGSPVFVGGRIIGVIVTCPKAFDATRLKATPIWRLLSGPAFKSAVDYETGPADINRLRRSVARSLSKSLNAMEALANEFEIENRKDEPLLWASALADALLFNFGLEEVLERVDNAHAVLWDVDGEYARTDADVIEDVAFQIVPAVFDPELVQLVRASMGQGGMAVIQLPVATHTVAEIVMAAAQGRHAKFREPATESEMVHGEFSVPWPPEEGIDRDCQRFMDSLHEHLREKLLPTEIRQRRGSKELIPLVADELKDRLDRGESYYSIIKLPAPVSARQMWETALRQIKEAYPALFFVTLDEQDVERERREFHILRPLRRILLRCTRGE